MEPVRNAECGAASQSGSAGARAARRARGFALSAPLHFAQRPEPGSAAQPAPSPALQLYATQRKGDYQPYQRDGTPRGGSGPGLARPLRARVMCIRPEEGHGREGRVEREEETIKERGS